jgi:hypothetical protein
MLPPLRIVSPLLALVILPIVTGRCEAQSYRDDDRHFSIELPRGWQPMSKTEIDQVNFLIGGRFAGMGVRYDGGLRTKSGKLGAYPYVLIQSSAGPPTGASIEEIEKSLLVDLSGPIKEAQKKGGDLVRDMKIVQPVFDRKSNCVITHTQSTVPGLGAVKGLTVGHIGKYSIIFIHCYAKAENYDACENTFRNINDWFSFDRGYEFKPGHGSVGLFGWQGAGRGGMVGGAVGLMVGLATYLIRLFSQSQTSKIKPSMDDDSQLDQLQSGETS